MAEGAPEGNLAVVVTEVVAITGAGLRTAGHQGLSPVSSPTNSSRQFRHSFTTNSLNNLYNLVQMPKRRRLSPQSVWDGPELAAAFEEAGIKLSWIPKLHQ